LLFLQQPAGWAAVQNLDEMDMTAYRAYLLRLWRTDTEETGGTGWRASLEDSHTGERLGFANLDQLFAFLLTLTEGAAGKGQAMPPATH
jgi:hypothetical protein